MIKKIFDEFFGNDSFDELFETVLKEFNEKKENEKEDKNKNNHSYFHKVADEYDNGQHVCHVEKEVKDGKVLKDINEKYNNKIENKSCNFKDKMIVDKLNQTIEEKDKKINDLETCLKNTDKILAEQYKELDAVKAQNKELLDKFIALKNIFS